MIGSFGDITHVNAGGDISGLITALWNVGAVTASHNVYSVILSVLGNILNVRAGSPGPYGQQSSGSIVSGLIQAGKAIGTLKAYRVQEQGSTAPSGGIIKATVRARQGDIGQIDAGDFVQGDISAKGVINEVIARAGRIEGNISTDTLTSYSISALQIDLGIPHQREV